MILDAGENVGLQAAQGTQAQGTEFNLKRADVMPTQRQVVDKVHEGAGQRSARALQVSQLLEPAVHMEAGLGSPVKTVV